MSGAPASNKLLPCVYCGLYRIWRTFHCLMPHGRKAIRWTEVELTNTGCMRDRMYVRTCLLELQYVRVYIAEYASCLLSSTCRTIKYPNINARTIKNGGIYSLSVLYVSVKRVRHEVGFQSLIELVRPMGCCGHRRFPQVVNDKDN